MNAVIVRMTPETLAVLLKLPAGSYIDHVHQPADVPGELQIRVVGMGWDVIPGQLIERVTPIVHTTTLEDGTTYVSSVDWRCPPPAEDVKA